VIKKVRLYLLVFGAVLGLLAALVWFTTYHPPQRQLAIPVQSGQPLIVKPGQKLKLMTWNVQYMAGKNYVFFYDLPGSAGPDTRPKPEDMAITVKEVGRVVRDENPDILLLQELDDGAKRTDYENQLQRLLAELPKDYCSYVSAYYWKAGFVPHPKILGAVGMKIAVISKYQIRQAGRHQLPLMPGNILLQQFNFKRAVLEARLPMSNGKEFTVLVTHLDAFAQGTRTMEQQVAQVKTLLAEMEQKQMPFVLGGDFNLLSPGAYDLLDPSQRSYYNPQTEMATLFKDFQVVPNAQETLGPERERWFTYFPNDPEIGKPDRTIDYFVLSNHLTVARKYVRQSDTVKISDHFPVIVEAHIPE
jgi:endonuclease/exonuclease/phosphatase family metal-dependent hydrolase